MAGRRGFLRRNDNSRLKVGTGREHVLRNKREFSARWIKDIKKLRVHNLVTFTDESGVLKRKKFGRVYSDYLPSSRNTTETKSPPVDWFILILLSLSFSELNLSKTSFH